MADTLSDFLSPQLDAKKKEFLGMDPFYMGGLGLNQATQQVFSDPSKLEMDPWEALAYAVGGNLLGSFGTTLGSKRAKSKFGDWGTEHYIPALQSENRTQAFQSNPELDYLAPLVAQFEQQRAMDRADEQRKLFMKTQTNPVDILMGGDRVQLEIDEFGNKKVVGKGPRFSPVLRGGKATMDLMGALTGKAPVATPTPPILPGNVPGAAVGGTPGVDPAGNRELLPQDREALQRIVGGPEVPEDSRVLAAQQAIQTAAGKIAKDRSAADLGEAKVGSLRRPLSIPGVGDFVNVKGSPAETADAHEISSAYGKALTALNDMRKIVTANPAAMRSIGNPADQLRQKRATVISSLEQAAIAGKDVGKATEGRVKRVEDTVPQVESIISNLNAAVNPFRTSMVQQIDNLVSEVKANATREINEKGFVLTARNKKTGQVAVYINGQWKIKGE